MKKILLPCLLMNLVHADISQVANTLTAATEASDTLNAATMGLYGTMTHGEIETGKGTMSMTGGFLGLNGKISDDVTTYTLKNEHQNIFAKPLNYGYKISWFDSDKINQAASTYNQSITTINTNIPAMDYKIRGLDADIGLGWDLINHGSHDYLSFGVDIGLSVPYIQSTKSSNTSNSGNLNTMVPLDEKGNTKIWTYKVGPQIKASKSLTSYLSLYGSAIYDYQYASVKNTSVGLNSKVDGTFIESEMGIRINLWKENIK